MDLARLEWSITAAKAPKIRLLNLTNRWLPSPKRKYLHPKRKQKVPKNRLFSAEVLNPTWSKNQVLLLAICRVMTLRIPLICKSHKLWRRMGEKSLSATRLCEGSMSNWGKKTHNVHRHFRACRDIEPSKMKIAPLGQIFYLYRWGWFLATLSLM